MARKTRNQKVMMGIVAILVLGGLSVGIYFAVQSGSNDNLTCEGCSQNNCRHTFSEFKTAMERPFDPPPTPDRIKEDCRVALSFTNCACHKCTNCKTELINYFMSLGEDRETIETEMEQSCQHNLSDAEIDELCNFALSTVT